MEKFLNGDTQAVTQLFDGGDGRAVIAPANDIVHGGLGHAAPGTQSIDGNILFLTQLHDSLPDSFAFELISSETSHKCSKNIVEDIKIFMERGKRRIYRIYCEKEI